MVDDPNKFDVSKLPPVETKHQFMDARIEVALNIARRYGQTEGSHHKTWVIDQMVRALLGCPVNSSGTCTLEVRAYDEWITDNQRSNPRFSWDEGIAP